MLRESRPFGQMMAKTAGFQGGTVLCCPAGRSGMRPLLPLLSAGLFIGPISSIFDYLTFFMMLCVFNCWHNPALFHTGWFVESLFTRTLIIHVIRTNKIPFIESRASRPLILTSVIIVAVRAWLTVSPLANTLGFVPLPPQYWLFLTIMLLGYAILTRVVKTWFIRGFGK